MKTIKDVIDMKTVKDITKIGDNFVVSFVEDEAKSAAKNIPSWATWDETQALNYIDTNVTDLASAKVVLKAFARLLVNLRDAQWPNLGS